ncbi:HORMA domain-containing protein 1 [Phlyctochytrium planicorne]|nr:HORMA domain-containing protein 1 [Phlyctochytrium planicorne]
MTTQQVQRSSVIPSQTESLTLVKNLMGATISAITYLRGLFPEENFRDTVLHSMPLKSIRRDYSVEADELLDCLEKGCYDALEKHYVGDLKTLIFGIYLDRSEPEKLIESYTFEFSYPSKDQWCITIGDSIKETFKMKTKKEIVKATSEMLRRVIVLTQTLRCFLDNAHVTLRLYYYDDVTPHDYEPPFFISGLERGLFTFPYKPERIQIGQIETPYHNLGLHVSTAADSISSSSDDIAAMGETTPSVVSCNHSSNYPRDEIRSFRDTRSPSAVPILDEKQIQANGRGSRNSRSEAQSEMETPDMIKKPATDSVLDTMGSFALGQSQILMPDSEQDIECTQELVQQLIASSKKQNREPNPHQHRVLRSQTSEESVDGKAKDGAKMSDSDDGSEVSCPCKANDVDGDMVLCHRCKTWGHAVCFGFIDANDKRLPEHHFCYGCHNEIEVSEGKRPMCNLDEASEVAIFRRALSIAWTEGVQSISWLSTRLTIPLSEAKKVAGRLEKEGILTQQKPKRGGKKKAGKQTSPAHAFEVLKTVRARGIYSSWMSTEKDPLVKKHEEPSTKEKTIPRQSSMRNGRKQIAAVMDELSNEVEAMQMKDMSKTLHSNGILNACEPARRERDSMSVDSSATRDEYSPETNAEKTVLVPKTPEHRSFSARVIGDSFVDPIDTVPLSSPELVSGRQNFNFQPSPPPTLKPFKEAPVTRESDATSHFLQKFASAERKTIGFTAGGSQNSKRKDVFCDKENLPPSSGERAKRRKVSVVKRDISVL